MKIWTVLTPHGYPHSFATEKLSVDWCVKRIMEEQTSNDRYNPYREMYEALFRHNEYSVLLRIHNELNDKAKYDVLESDLTGHAME